MLTNPEAHDLGGVRTPIAFNCAWAVLTGEYVVRINLSRDLDRDAWCAAYCVDADGQGDKRQESNDHLGKKP